MEKDNIIERHIISPSLITGGGRGVGLFPGSFDPFTIGHADIVERALKQFDKVIIGMGVNDKKTYTFDRIEELNRIKSLYEGDPRVEVKSFSGFTTDFARVCGASAIVKGVRSVKDFEYEREQADINLAVGGVDTVILFCRPELASISSSLVRTFKAFGKDYSMFLPKKRMPNSKL